MPTSESTKSAAKLRVMSFDELMGHLVCPACERQPHPHTAMVLKVGDRCDWSDCGKASYVHKSEHLA